MTAMSQEFSDKLYSRATTSELKKAIGSIDRKQEAINRKLRETDRELEEELSSLTTTV